MRPYGHQRYDTITCRYGCCTTKYSKHKNAHEITDRSRRKTARQEGKTQIFSQLIKSE